jgi:hypothetical protein
VQGEPGAILVVELFGESQVEIEQKPKQWNLPCSPVDSVITFL